MTSKRFVTKEKDIHNQEENHHNQKRFAQPQKDHHNMTKKKIITTMEEYQHDWEKVYD
jgi:hypothetical protein